MSVIQTIPHLSIPHTPPALGTLLYSIVVMQYLHLHPYSAKYCDIKCSGNHAALLVVKRQCLIHILPIKKQWLKSYPLSSMATT